MTHTKLSRRPGETRIAQIAFTAFCLVLLLAVPQARGQEKAIEKLKPAETEKIKANLDRLQQFLFSEEPIDPSKKSNGCGPQWLPGFDRLINRQTFKGRDSITKQKVEFIVDFKLACDLHDTGYAGLYVINRFGEGPNAAINFATWTKAAIDRKFLYDLSKICDLTIPESNPNAREKCKSYNLGARAYYRAVNLLGYTTFDCNLSLPGLPWQKPCTRAYE